jgi:hypothetical protein
MQGAEERRLRRMNQYAASLPRRRPGEERALARLRREGNAADDALMVDQGHAAVALTHRDSPHILLLRESGFLVNQA